MTLENFFNENPSAALAFSGGVDSSYLLYAALRYGANVRAYFVKTAFQPQFELNDARRLAELLNAPLTVIEADVLSDARITSNPADRCYFCKNAIFNVIKERAASDGYTLLLDGTNASDDASDRPGMKALAQLAVRSPLRECGITKDELRRLSKEAGLFTWDKPAYACLATRIPTGREVTADLLQRVEKAEDALFTLGFTDFRARVLGGAAKLQLTERQIQKAFSMKDEIVKAVKPYFSAVLLDLEGR
jgi:uncharacterized protein